MSRVKAKKVHYHYLFPAESTAWDTQRKKVIFTTQYKKFIGNGQWRVGVSPEDIEARFYVRWLTKTKKEIHQYTNQAWLSTSTELPARLNQPGTWTWYSIREKLGNGGMD